MKTKFLSFMYHRANEMRLTILLLFMIMIAMVFCSKPTTKDNSKPPISTEDTTKGVSQVQKNALITIYNTMGGNNWTNKWDTTQPIKDWYGVTVNDKGNITAINLSNNNLTGSIPADIVNLTELVSLDLHNNNLTGNIPSQIATLATLTTLKVNDNMMSGTIPNEIKNKWVSWNVVGNISPQKRGYGFDFAVRFDGDSRTLFNSTRTKPYTIVVLGDGFREQDNIVGGRFDMLTKKVFNFIFSVEPYKAYKEYFKICQVYANSVDSGADLDYRVAPIKNTAFKSGFNVAGIGRLTSVREVAKVKQYIANAGITADAILVIINDGKAGGSGGEIVTVTTHVSSIFPTSLHELSHNVGGLGDEYEDAGYVAASHATRESIHSKFPNLDALWGGDTTLKDTTKLKWYRYIQKRQNGDTRYNGEGAFSEGGKGYFANGVWAPTFQSIMGTYTASGGYVFFNGASREAIVRKVLQKVGETFSYDAFDAKDVPPKIAVSNYTFWDQAFYDKW